MAIRYVIDKIVRLKALGYARAFKTIHHRFTQKYAGPYNTLPDWYDLPTESMYDAPIFSHIHTIEHYIDSKELIALADRYAQNCFEIHGSSPQCFTEIPWHCDIRLRAQNPSADCMFDASTYYKNIALQVCQDKNLGKDIKVPWELARCTYVPVLGLAYHITKNKQYADAAQKQIISWIDANPVCHGIHWFNGMEVAIRATNWIIALQWLQKPFSQDSYFYQRLCSSLYNHMQYLEHNWEWYDGRTNNHYVANLVGYAYLCAFFHRLPSIKKKWQWCYEQLVQEFTWQIFDEGSSYEGSTRYHHFVTELFLHGFLLAKNRGESLDTHRQKKLEQMVLFIEQCKLNAQDAIIIGDDDSGSLLDIRIFKMHYLYQQLGINQSMLSEPQQKYYKQFGISISKDRNWHISLRHHAYTKRQPTGHFHHDAGSITIAYQGVPIIVDPGTYVYTASSYWRNYFRSAAVHNTLYTDVIPENNNLFALSLDSSVYNDTFMSTYIPHEKGMMQRTVIIEEKQVRIIDQCLFTQPHIVTWNFTFASSIQLDKKQDSWYAMINNKLRIHYSSALTYTCSNAWISQYYGCVQKTVCLQAAQEVMHDVIEHVVRVID